MYIYMYIYKHTYIDRGSSVHVKDSFVSDCSNIKRFECAWPMNVIFASMLGQQRFLFSKIDFVWGYVGPTQGWSWLAPNEVNFRGQKSSRLPHRRSIENQWSCIFKFLYTTQVWYKRIFYMYRASAININIFTYIYIHIYVYLKI